MHFLFASSGLASCSKNLPLYGVAFSDAGPPSTRELPTPLPFPSLEDLNFGLRLPKQQMIEHKKLDRFFETEKNKKIFVKLKSNSAFLYNEGHN